MGLGRYLVDAVIFERRSPTELARTHGISRSRIYQLIARYHAGGYAALEPRSRRPRGCAHAVPLRVYHAIAERNPGIRNNVVIGPWVHGGWSRFSGRRLGSVDFAADTAAYYRENVVLPFFEFHLKDANDPELPGAVMFETGTNVWRRYPSWPQAEATTGVLYFRAGGGLSFGPPEDDDASDSYVSDPAKPVPYVGYTAPTVPDEYMVSDQRFPATRPDVLVYVTEPLADDITFAGPVSPRLFVSTTGTDSDWVVKLIDVYPAERSEPPGADGDGPATDVGPPVFVRLAGYQ